MKWYSKILPSGFKHVPSNPMLAVAKNGEVLDAQTLLNFSVRTRTDGKTYIAINTWNEKLRHVETETHLVEDLIKEAFGGSGTVVWRDIPGFEAYKISQGDGTVVNKATGDIVPIEKGRQDTVLIFKSGRELRNSVWRLLQLAFPEDYNIPVPEESYPECGEKLVNHRAKTITVNNAPIALEGLRQIQGTKGRHYPGPLRDQTIWDLIDHLIKELEKTDA